MPGLETIANKDGSGNEAVVFLYPNDSRADSYIKSSGVISEAVVNGLDQLESNGAIGGYEVYRFIPDSYPELPDSTKGEFSSSFFDWLTKSDADGSTNRGYWGARGVHFGIARGFDGAGGENKLPYRDAEFGDGFDFNDSGSTAFNEPLQMVLGTGSLNDERIRSFAIQEPLHQFIAFELIRNGSYVDNSGHEHEHDLGVVYSNNATSPMATTYASGSNQHAYHGSGASDGCDNFYDWDGFYSQDLTRCTIDAVNITENNS